MDELLLLDWKRRVFALYAEIRAAGGEAAWRRWRDARDELFRDHPQSPLLPEARVVFNGLPYFPYDSELRVLAEVAPGDGERREIDASGEQTIVFRRFATARFELAGAAQQLSLKGADLGTEDGRLVLDFNFAYNPSCAYDPAWVCPLAQPGNTLAVPVRAGEMVPG